MNIVFRDYADDLNMLNYGEIGECEAQYPGCEGMGVAQEDPYQADVFNEIVLMVLCDNCAAERAADI